MYKVFFNDRTVQFIEESSNQAERKDAEYHTYTGVDDLYKVITRFALSDNPGDLFLISQDQETLVKEFRAWFKNIQAGGGLVFNHEGKFLVIKRNGVWDLPKGKLEKGEDLESAALREVNEETGLTGLVLSQPLISTYHTYRLKEKWVLKTTRWFEMNYSGEKEPVLEAREGITDYRWANKGDTDFITKNSYGSILDVLRIRDLI